MGRKEGGAAHLPRAQQGWPLLAVLLLLIGCVPAATPALEPSPSLQPPTATPSPPDPVREVVVALPALADNLNPLYARSWPARVLPDLFLAGLWRLDSRLQPHPDLATEIPTRANGGISEDGRILTIHLRPEAAWSNGQPLTVDDLVFTYQMAVAEGNGVAHRFPYAAHVDSVIPLDAHTVEVRFTRPFAPWPSSLFPYVLPRHVLEPVFQREGTLDRAVWNRLPTVASGPFVFVGVDGDDLVFEANPTYWRGRPAVDRLRVRSIPDPEARWEAVAAGEVGLAPLLWPESAGQDVAPPGARLVSGPSGWVETLFFNLDPRSGHPALQQEEVRRAIAAALDRGMLCPLLPGRAEPATSLWAGTIFEAPGAGSAPAMEAGRLLEEAGWWDEDGDGVRERDGTVLILRYAVPEAGVDRGAVAAAVAEMLSQVGIGVTAATVEGGWDLAEWAEPPAGYPDPDDPRWLCAEAHPGGMNRVGVCDEELDALLIAQAMAPDLDERTALFSALEALNRERTWWVPLCRISDLWLVSDHLEGLHPWREGPFWNVGEW